MTRRHAAPWFQRVCKFSLAALVVQFTLTGPTAWSQDVTLEVDEVTAAIKGQDVAIHARTSAEVDEVKLWIRKLLELGPFNDVPMEKTGATTWRYVLPLSQEQGEVGRLEYYVEAFRGGQSVAKVESNVISFIDPPFIGEITAAPTEGLEKEDWKLFIKGRISRPFYKRWWVYAIAGAVAIPATYFLTKTDPEPPGPPTVQLSKDPAALRDGTFSNLCERVTIPLDLVISGGVPPYEAIFTMARDGGSSNANVVGVVANLGAADTVVLPLRTFDAPGDFTIDYPAVDVLASGFVGTTNVIFSAIVRDAESATQFGGVGVGGVLPQNIINATETDERVLREIAFDVIVHGGLNCPP